MKPTAVITLLAFAFTATVIAVPTPSAPEVPAVQDVPSFGTLEARDPIFNTKKKIFPGTNGYKKRNAEDEDDNEVSAGVLEARDPRGAKGYLLASKHVYPGQNGY